MVQEDQGNSASVISTSISRTITTAHPGNDHDTDYNPKDDSYKSYPSDTVAAITIAVLAVIIIITMLIVFRALRKRQRARRGEQFGENVIPTITTGVMGSGGAAYSSSLSSVPVRGPVRWESINPATSDSTSGAEQGATAR